MNSSRALVRTVLAAARRDWTRRWRDPLALGLWLGIPLVIGGLMTLAMGGRAGSQPKAHVLVVLEDDGWLAGLLFKALSSEQAGVIQAERVEQAEGRARIERGEASALLVVPQGFTAAVWNEWPIALELVTNPSQRVLPGIVSESLAMLSEFTFYAHRVFGPQLRELLGSSLGRDEFAVARSAVGLSRGMERAGAHLFPPAIELRTHVREQPSGPPRKTAGYFLPAMLMMALMFMAEGLADDVWTERSSGALRRAVSTPSGAAPSLFGKQLAGGALMSLVALVACGLGALGLGLEAWRALLAALWVSAVGVVFLGLLTALKLYASSQRAAGVIGNLVLFPLLMLGGSFVPFAMMPDWLAQLGRRTPSGRAVDLLDQLLFGAPSAAAILIAFAAAAAAFAAAFALCVQRYGGAFARGGE